MGTAVGRRERGERGRLHGRVDAWALDDRGASGRNRLRAEGTPAREVAESAGQGGEVSG